VTGETPPPDSDLQGLLRRLEESRLGFVAALEASDPHSFARQTPEGESLKAVTERTSDDLNFYYGRLVANAVSLPQPPCLNRADFSSLREAVVALQVAHRRFSNLLHDLQPPDLERTASDEEQGTYTLRQVLEMAAGAYRLREQQVRNISGAAAREKA